MIFRSAIPRQQLAFVAVVFLLMGCLFNELVITAQSPSNHNRQRVMRPAKTKESKKLFKQHCAKCHGVDGAGKTVPGQIAGAPDFTDPTWQNQFDDQRLINSVTHGRSQMPAFGKKLTQQQIKTLVSYVRAFRQ
jgi:mono/diheme cytochrome c family protein